MKLYKMTGVVSGFIASVLTCNSYSATLHPVDEVFVKQSEQMGVTQAVWDQAEFAAVTFPNAYKYMPHYQVSRDGADQNGQPLAPEQWRMGSALDLSKLSGNDVDGSHDLLTLLRDRIKNHSMVVLQGDQLRHQHFYNGMDENSTHLSMSVTKSFTAMLAAIAVAEGRLDMSKPVEFYLPDFKGTAFEGVSVQVVADMRSGLDIPTPPFMSWDPLFTASQEWNGPNDSGLHGIRDYLKTIKKRKYGIGEVYQYQDPNTEVLGLIVEEATGIKLADYLEQKIWQKLGAENDALWMADPAEFPVASGGLNVTTRDLARVGRMILNDGKNYVGEQVIPKAFIDRLFKGNADVKSAWAKGKESALIADAWYQDQFRLFNVKGHTMLIMVGIHGQLLIMDKATNTAIAMHGGYGQTESARAMILVFLEALPAIFDALKKS